MPDVAHVTDRLTEVPFQTGDVIGTSGWQTISQARIDEFAHATGDFQFIHVDPQRATREGPFGGTIAHGFLTLSLLSAMATEVIPQPELLGTIVITGIDRVKFMSPVRVGERVRGVFTFNRALRLADDRLLLKIHAAVEIEGAARPALTCDVSWVATTNPDLSMARAV